MHRLLQGDVGSGKTVVALAALLTAVQGGYQGAFMAPTEVLAEQHYLGSVRLLDGLTVGAQGSLLGDRPVRVELLTNRTTAAERRRIAAGLARNEVDILVGTHALLYGDAEFTNLGLAVIDEQHRFGVEQRALLQGKATGEVVPDVLVMTATPIPRTAGMLVYGDLDKSELREMPPGRTPIETEVVGTDALDQVRMWQTLPRRGRGGSPGVRRVPARRRQGDPRVRAARSEREGRGQGGDRGVRTAAGGGAAGSAARPLARAAAREGQGSR